MEADFQFETIFKANLTLLHMDILSPFEILFLHLSTFPHTNSIISLYILSDLGCCRFLISHFFSCLLDPSADGTQPRWEQLQPAGTPPPRHYHCAVVFGDRMYIFGGYRGSTFTADIWAYEFLTNRWVRIDGLSPLSNRRGASCVLLPHRRSCAIMGGRDDKRRLNDLIEFKFDDHNWSALRNVGDPPQSRVFHSGFLHDRSLYFFGGLNIYNTNDMLEYVLEPLLMPTPRSSPSLTSSSLDPPSSRGDHPKRSGKLIYYPEKTYGGARIDFSSLVFSNTFSDVTFVVKHTIDDVTKEDKIYGHRCILYAASPHFKRLFDSAMKEASDGIIEISDLAPEILREILHFIYTGRLIRLTTENVAEVLQAADKFLIYELVELIITSLSLIITRDNITHIITLSSSVPSASEGLLIQCINFLASDPLQPNFIDALNLIEDLDGESHIRLKKIHETEKARVQQRERILAARKALADETTAASAERAAASSTPSSSSPPISSATASSSARPGR